MTSLARRAVLGALVSFALVGCRGGKSAPPMATLRVTNNFVPAVQLTISLIPASGARRTLGVIEASKTQELRFEVGAGTDPHRLIAEAGSGAASTSREFVLATASLIEWNVGRNVVNVSMRR